jgi:hypothetical protein
MEAEPQVEAVEVGGEPVPRSEAPLGGPRPHDGKTVRDLMRDLSHDTTLLVRQETELFRREMELRVNRLERQAAVFGGGGVVAYVGVLALTAAVILLLSLVMAAWGAALIVGAVYVTVGGLAVLLGRKRIREQSLEPEETVESVKQDVHAMQEAIR